MAKLATLIDDFQDGVINSLLWNTTGTAAETSGRARLTPGTTYAIWGSVDGFDLTDSQITIDVPVVVATGTTGSLQCGLALELDASYQISMRKVGTNLICSEKLAGVTSNLAFVTYNATNHKFWRIRESGGNVIWETSATGTGTFFIQNIATVASLFDVTTIFPFFFAGYAGVEAAPGTFQIESVNLPAQITASGTSTSAGSAALLLNHLITGTGVSTSAGSVAILIRHLLSGSATSTSAGSTAISIPPLTPRQLIGSAVSTSAGTAFFIILTPDQMTAAGQSFSAGSAALIILNQITATGSSASMGTAAITIYTPPPAPSSVQYYTFEPPVVYDRPTTIHPPRPRYINAYARWQKGQARGRPVIKNDSSYLTIDSPTVDQMNSADAAYLGGHIYTVDQTEANALSAAGYTVTAILDDITKPILTILAPRAGANVDQLVHVLLATSEPSSLSGTLSTVAITYPITILSTSFTIDTSSLPNATYRLTVTAQDLALNSTSDYVDFHVIHPTIEIPIGTYPSLDTFPSLILYPTEA